MSRLLAEIRRQEMHRAQMALLADALAGTGEKVMRAPRSAAGDGSRLRGIPMIGGSGGHVPGTRPGTDAHLDQVDRRRRRRSASTSA